LFTGGEVKFSGRSLGLSAAVAVTAGVTVAVAYSASAATHAATESLLSQGKTAIASSLETSAFPASNAVDGSASTRWASKEGVDPQWIQVDLGTSDSISHVNLKWEAAYAKSYKVQTSADGSSWTTIYSTTTGDGGTDDLTALTGTGRFVRVYGTARGTTYGYSIYELKVYGSAGTPTSPSPTPTGTTASPTPSPTPTATPTSTPTKSPTPTPTPTSTGGHVNLTDPHKKEIAMELVSSAENSSLDWKAQYKYIEDIGDGRGYTAGIIGFCSGTGDMLEMVQHYTDLEPGNILAKYIPALKKVNGTASHTGLGDPFVADWKTAAKDTVFQTAQNDERDSVYFNPAVQQAEADGLHALGQFMYYDAMVMHGPGDDPVSFGGIRKTAMSHAKTPAQGGNETTYLNAYLDARKAAMLTEAAHDDTSRVDTEQRVFLNNGNLDLNPPLSWKTYGDSYTISS
jgi:chitosanase